MFELYTQNLLCKKTILLNRENERKSKKTITCMFSLMTVAIRSLDVSGFSF